MVADHKAAFAAALFGLISLVLFLAPLFIYAGEYSEHEKQNRGRINGGDIFSMVAQGLGIHIGLLFLFTVGFEIIDLVMKANADLRPSEALKTFYMISSGTGDVNAFIKKWMTTTFTGSGIAPLTAVAYKSFALFMVSLGLILTMIFITLPIVIIVLAIKFGMSADEKQNESALEAIMGASGFFVGATLLVLVHSLIASSLVRLITGTVDFSFFSALKAIWNFALFGVH